MTRARHQVRKHRRLFMAAAAVLAGAAVAVVVETGAQGANHAQPRAASASSAPTSGKWLGLSHGHLVYGHDAQGNRIPDYSYAGYDGGGVALPQVPARVNVPAPGTGDETATIQAAIDKASALPLDVNGFRGAVQLAKGSYHIAGQLHITASGVVLRGAGTSSSGTTLVADQPTVRTLLTIGAKSRYTTVGTAQQVTDDYVPVGGTTLTLGSTQGLSVGDEVVVERPTTQAWIDAIGMTGAWSPNWSLRSERKITAINGDRVTIDFPLTTALEKQYTQATVYRYSFPRIDHVGVENLSEDGQAMSAAPDYSKSFYNAAPWEFNAVEDSWVNNVVWHHFGGSGQTALGPQSRRISVLHTQALDMITTNSSARSEAYLLQGQENLVQDCAVTAAKIHAFSTYGRQAGPNAFANCKATLVKDTYDAGGHERWGSGTLYDNVSVDGSLLLVNNGSRGTGHGWSDANSTAYNCTTQQYMVEEPPTAHNWAIGCTGTLMNGSDGQVQSSGQHTMPTSLYAQQLLDRGATH
ncbi:peptidoglycan-binding protein [Streptantibioticus ferralitis]|uniref:Peptidoglycan-binding protein n=1 Tax=Streptantibioticus ferralitis TaxID=236510 RepID=A0ABT5YU66_9ACTN|nr:peptidoglycan-binding protein [Streptantibioticus ferralitis]MDF2255065.1 peptidoglycan-binding protein [Streptantibioticus ferralitis]